MCIQLAELRFPVSLRNSFASGTESHVEIRGSRLITRGQVLNLNPFELIMDRSKGELFTFVFQHIPLDSNREVRTFLAPSLNSRKRKAAG